MKREGYIPLRVFCAAHHQIGRLPSVSASLSFRGHIRDLPTYYAAGCFVQHLIDTYGEDRFAEVYHTGDFHGVYGQDLPSLEAEWIATIASSNYVFDFDPDRLAYYVTEVADAYDRLFTNFTGSTEQMSAYWELDRARVALLQGRLDDTEAHLASLLES